ncbi:MAG: hypothetical protein Q7R49_02510 [Candidatus Daviesbacteria bacterium]|nr:hypothetical protein [Candidatus Daviesbacteria bacterium]
MSTKKDSQEAGENFFIRLINVLYFLGWMSVIIVIGFVFLISKPNDYLNDEKSYVSCLTNKQKYTLSKIEEYLNLLPNRSELGLYTTEAKAQYICEIAIEEDLSYSDKKDWVWSDRDQDWFPNTQANRDILIGNVKNEYPVGIYKINEIYSTNGSWGSTFAWAIGAFIVLALILDVLKAVLLYLATGRKVSVHNFLIVKVLHYTYSDNSS